MHEITWLLHKSNTFNMRPVHFYINSAVTCNEHNFIPAD